MSKTLTIELPEELAARLAAVSPEDLNAFAVAVVAAGTTGTTDATPALGVTTDDGREAAARATVLARLREEAKETRATRVPQWLLDLKPENPGGLASVVGRWPGDETDEEIKAALEELS